MPTAYVSKTDMVQGTHIHFRRYEEMEKGVTQYWAVFSERGDDLGLVHWYTAWRKYCFFPERDTIYEEVCLREVAAFCERLTTERKAERAKERDLRT